MFNWYKTYFPDGKLRSITDIKNDKRNGEEKLFLENGNLFMLQYYKDDMPTDSVIQYDKDLPNVPMLRGINSPRAHLTLYDNKGVLFAETDFRDKAVEDGLVCVYFDNGNVSVVSQYKNGAKNGIHIKYYHNGNIKELTHYSNGAEILPKIIFDSLGHIIANSPFAK